MAKRYSFIDHYRGWAVVVMIETHSINAWLSETVRQQSWFGFLNHINGLVAPSFLFIAGISFAIIASRKFDVLSRITPESLKLLRRYLWIWVLGYLMHLPRIRWAGWRPFVVNEDLASFYQPDVLQAIAVSLIVLLLLCWLIRDRRKFYGATLTLTILALIATPYVWSVDFSRFVPPFIANYLNGLHNPLFPLFPWAIFVWSGALVGAWFLRVAATDDKAAIAAAEVLGCGIALFLGGMGLSKLHWIPYRNFWVDSPDWALMRLGLVCALFCTFWRLESRGIKGAAPFVLVGTESLFAYVFHLEAIFSITSNKALLLFLKYRGYSLTTTLLLYGSMLILTIVMTFLWVRIRLKNVPPRQETVIKGASAPGSSASE